MRGLVEQFLDLVGWHGDVLFGEREEVSVRNARRRTISVQPNGSMELVELVDELVGGRWCVRY